MFSTDFEKSSDFKFDENPSAGSRIVTCGQTNIRIDGRTDRQIEAHSHFAILAMRLTRNMASSFLMRFLDHTQRRTTVGKDSSGRVISPSQRPLPDNTQHSQQTDIQAPGGVRTYNLSRRAAADLHLRPRGHWDRLTTYN